MEGVEAATAKGLEAALMKAVWCQVLADKEVAGKMVGRPSTWWPSKVLSTGVAAAPGMNPYTAAGARGRGVWRVSGAAAALVSVVLAWR
jgi:hypothetical protein